MEILHLALLVVISIVCFKIGQGLGQKDLEKNQSQYIQLQENEQLIEEIDEDFIKQVDQQEQDLKEAVKKYNEINQRDKQLQKQLNELKNTQTNNAKPKVQQNELLSDKDFDNLLDEGFVVDQEINETQLDQDLIEASTLQIYRNKCILFNRLINNQNYQGHTTINDLSICCFYQVYFFIHSLQILYIYIFNSTTLQIYLTIDNYLLQYSLQTFFCL